MNNTLSLKKVCELLQDIGSRITTIQTSIVTSIDKIPSNIIYPALIIDPANFTLEYGEDNARHGQITYEFNLYFFDKSFSKAEFNLQQLSNAVLNIRTFTSELKNNGMFKDLDMHLISDVNAEMVSYSHADDVSGYTTTISISLPLTEDLNQLPIEPVDYYTTQFNEIKTEFINLGLQNFAAGEGLTYVYNNKVGTYSLTPIHATESNLNGVITSLQYDVFGRVTGASTSIITTDITFKEVDESPTLAGNTIIAPNGSIAATSSGILINQFNGKRNITRSGYSGLNLNTTDVNEFLEAFFFPAVNPTLSLTSNSSSKEFGATTSVLLTWQITKQTRGISSIKVSDEVINIPSTIDDDSDTIGTVANGSLTLNTAVNTNTTFNLIVRDSANNSFSTTTTVTYFNKRYWGRVSSTSVSDANIITALGGGSEFSTSRAQTRNGLNGLGDYLFFAFPSSFGTPTFTVNGLPNTAFTKVRANSPFVNASGYTTNYDVWVSNTPQNSPLNISIS